MAGKTVDEIFGDQLKDAVELQAKTMTSIAMINDGKGHFAVVALPYFMQWSPIFSFVACDFNNDGKMDLLAGGNFYGVIPFEGKYDAMALSLGIGDGRGNFDPVLQHSGPLLRSGEIRDMQQIKIDGNSCLIVARNNDQLQFIKILNHDKNDNKTKH